MKKIFFPLLILCIGATVSCKKEVMNERPPAVSSGDASNLTTDTTAPNWGIIISSNLTTDDRIKVLNNLGVKYLRTATILSTFNGKDGALDKYISQGYKVILNLN